MRARVPSKGRRIPPPEHAASGLVRSARTAVHPIVAAEQLLGNAAVNRILQRAIVSMGSGPDAIRMDDRLPPQIQALFTPGMLKPQVEAVLAQLRTQVPYEIGATFHPDGRLKNVARGYTASNGPANVRWQDLEIDLTNAGIQTHSHPQGLPLSSGDFGTTVKNSFTEMRAVGITITSIRRRDPKQPWTDEKDDAQRLLTVSNQHVAAQNEWPLKCQEALGVTEVAVGPKQVDLTQNKFLAHWWAADRLAKRYDWIFEDSEATDIRSYARIVLERIEGATNAEAAAIQPAGASTADAAATATSAAASP